MQRIPPLLCSIIVLVLLNECVPAATSTQPAQAVLDINGLVVNDATGQPVADYAISLGLEAGPGLPLVWFEHADAKKQPGGRFSFSVRLAGGSVRLRVSKPGYLPADSPSWSVDGPTPQQYEFRLKPAKKIEGIVLSPDGRPAADAAVVLTTPDVNAWMSGGDPKTLACQGGAVYHTDAKGHFSAEPLAGAYRVTAVATNGIAEADDLQLARGPLTLQAWGSIEGTVMLGNKPGKDVRVQAIIDQPQSEDEIRRIGRPIYISYETKTDANGRFRLERVAPGRYNLGRPINTGRNSTITAAEQSLTVHSGQPVKTTLGGTGRKVTARLNFSRPVQESWARTDISLHPPVGLIVRSPDALKSFVGRIDDGGVLFENVAAGTYELEIKLYRDEAAGADSDRPSARASVVVTVPPVRTKEDLDEPVILAPIKLTLD